MDLTKYVQDVMDVVSRVWPYAATAIASYAVGRRNAHEATKHRRRQLASALLIDLRFIEGILREMYAEPLPLNHFWYAPAPLFQRLLPEIRDLSDHAMYLATTFYGLILDLEARRDVAAKVAPPTAAHQHAYRVKAGFAVQRLNELVAALKAEGGALPPDGDVVTHSGGHLPPLPPPCFD